MIFRSGSVRSRFAHSKDDLGCELIDWTKTAHAGLLITRNTADRKRTKAGPDERDPARLRTFTKHGATAPNSPSVEFASLPSNHSIRTPTGAALMTSVLPLIAVMTSFS